MNYGLIGNCRYSALIDEKAKVNWLCWPRFDSPAVFASLLDEDKGGSFEIVPHDCLETNQNYVSNTNILTTKIKTKDGVFEIIDFAPRFMNNDRVYMPSMLVRIIRILEGTPKISVKCHPKVNYGSAEPSINLGSNHIEYLGFESRLRLTTNQALTYVSESRPFVLENDAHFVLTWGAPMEADLVETCETFLTKTKSYWRSWVKACRLPKTYQESVIRSALALKLHQFEDTGAITAATTTSLPEHNNSGRNWDYRFCWLRDTYFTLSAFDLLGHFQEKEKFWKYLENLIAFSDGKRLQPVYGINGEAKLIESQLDHLSGYKNNKPVRIGNQAYEHIQNDVYGESVLAIVSFFEDSRFSSKNSPPPWKTLEKLLEFLENTIRMEDAGLWEFRGKQALHTFSVLMTWAGARKIKEVALLNNKEEFVKRAELLEKESTHIINEEIYDSEKGFFPQGKGGSASDASLLALINFGFLSPDDPRAHSHLKHLEKNLVAENGLVFRYNEADDFGTPEVAFTVCGFWYVEALARLGYFEKATQYFEFYLNNGNHLGLFSEDIHPETLEMWGNFPQTYSHVGVINVAFVLEYLKPKHPGWPNI